MLLHTERELLITFGKKMVAAGLTTGTGGNLSMLDETRKLLVITPSGMDYADLHPNNVVVMDRSGKVVDSDNQPSSEAGFHLALYDSRQDIRAVVHTHSVYATTMACLNWEIPAVHYLVGFCGNKVPLAPYATYGTQELARNVAEHIGSYNAVLLANHGLVAVGRNLGKAFETAEEVELVAQIYYRCKAVGNPVILDESEMQRVIAKFSSYGKKDK
jgi:L-fuculose-phosphate aldolase